MVDYGWTMMGTHFLTGKVANSLTRQCQKASNYFGLPRATVRIIVSGQVPKEVVVKQLGRYEEVG